MPNLKRTRKLVKAGLQLRLTLVFVALAALSALFQVVLLDVAFRRAFRDSGLDAAAVDTTGILFTCIVLSLLVLAPTMLAVGILVTHRIAGPVYRFEQHLRALARGESPGPCKIRGGDELQELCRLINSAVEALRARGSRADAAAAPDECRPAA